MNLLITCFAASISLSTLSDASKPSTVSPNYGPQPSAALQAELLAIREKAWRAWFSNDVPRFREAVPAELLAIGWEGSEWKDRQQSEQAMQQFAESGTKLTSLSFPRNAFQYYGETVILYSTFDVVLSAKDGARSQVSGRATEVFVRRDKRWIHTGWHLDQTAESTK
jgi:ketosteroid isomerase-like protein